MSEKLPLYIHAHNEGKPLNELLFWQDFYLGRALLLVLENEPTHELPMVLIPIENERDAQPLKMPQTMEAELAREEELSESLLEMVEVFRKKS